MDKRKLSDERTKIQQKSNRWTDESSTNIKQKLEVGDVTDGAANVHELSNNGGW
jgi:hypothetical protein